MVCAFLTQRHTICFLQPIIFSTARTHSPAKIKPATSAPHQSLRMSSALTILSPRARYLSPRDWKNTHTAPVKTPNQTNLEGRESCQLLRKTNKKGIARQHAPSLQLPVRVRHDCSYQGGRADSGPGSALPGYPMPSGCAGPTGHPEMKALSLKKLPEVSF